jgi:hypothetical protein
VKSRLARTAMSMFLPVMAQRAGLPISKIGGWMGFLAAAEPAVRRCERGPERATLCVDYGGLDVFVVAMVKQGGDWAVKGVAWRQKGRAAGK